MPAAQVHDDTPRPGRATHSAGQLVRQALAATTSGQLDALGQFYAAGLVDHDESGEPPAGLEGLKQAAADFHAAFSNVECTIDDLLEAGDRVAARWTTRATHTGPFQGIPATQRQVALSGMEFFRVAEGKIVERWLCADELGLLQQLVDRRQAERSAPAGQERRARAGRR